MPPTVLRVHHRNCPGAVDVPQFFMVLCNCRWRISTTTAAKFTTMFKTEAVCCCTSCEYNTLILLARLMLLAVIVISVEKVDSHSRRIKPQCLGCSTYLYSPSTFMGKLGSSKLRYFDVIFLSGQNSQLTRGNVKIICLGSPLFKISIYINNSDTQICRSFLFLPSL